MRAERSARVRPALRTSDRPAAIQCLRIHPVDSLTSSSASSARSAQRTGGGLGGGGNGSTWGAGTRGEARMICAVNGLPRGPHMRSPSRSESASPCRVRSSEQHVDVCVQAPQSATPQAGRRRPAAAANRPLSRRSSNRRLTYKETVVVSASKVEQQLVDAPGTMTIIGARELSVAPSGTYGDVLRNVPGVNVTGSAPTSTTPAAAPRARRGTSQLAVLDGRTLPGFLSHVGLHAGGPRRKSSALRSFAVPASAVGAANELNGVIKRADESPRGWARLHVEFSGGMNRDVNDVGEGAPGRARFLLAAVAGGIAGRTAFRGSVPSPTGVRRPNG